MSPLPSSSDGKALYVSTRDLFNRLRRGALERSAGDESALRDHVRDHLALMAEFAQFRESVDFATQEGFLDQTELDAAANAIAWGDALVESLRRIEI